MPLSSTHFHLNKEPSETEFVSHLLKPDEFCFCFIILFILKRVGCCGALKRLESSKTDLEIEC